MLLALLRILSYFILLLFIINITSFVIGFIKRYIGSKKEKRQGWRFTNKPSPNGKKTIELDSNQYHVDD